MLTASFWRSRRSAAIAGIVFAVLLLTAMTMMRIALTEVNFQSLQTDAQRRSLIRLSLHLVPFAGIAFLWFIGVVREQLGDVEDRLFSLPRPALWRCSPAQTPVATSSHLVAATPRR
jgi:hypothetical protein